LHKSATTYKVPTRISPDYNCLGWLFDRESTPFPTGGSQGISVHGNKYYYMTPEPSHGRPQGGSSSRVKWHGSKTITMHGYSGSVTGHIDPASFMLVGWFADANASCDCPTGWSSLPSPHRFQCGASTAVSQTAEETCNRDAQHHLPDHLERVGKRLPNLVLDWLPQRWNDRDRRDCDLGALWERVPERRRATFSQARSVG
jgi:hypothetical protein